MREEISAAVIFLARLIGKGENFNQRQLEDFKTRLSELLTERFENHWFPDSPQKGQGYRCIRVNEIDRRDASLEKAARACGIRYEDMKLPVELTIWVDPNEVCCRFGENKGSYCTLASFNGKENVLEVSDEIKELLQVELTDVLAPVEKTESPVPNEEESTKPEVKEEKKEVAQQTESSEPAVKESKPQVSPLTTNNSRPPHQSNGRKYPQSSPKQKSRRGGNMPGGYPPHHPMQSWYNIISPHWMSPSPPPYHPMLRRPGAPLPPHHHHSRYHWPNKSMLKV